MEIEESVDPIKYPASKVCTKCGLNRHWKDFRKIKCGNRSKHKYRLDSWCNLCYLAYHESHRAKPEVALRRKAQAKAIPKQQRKGYNLKSKYGMTLAQFDVIWAEQMGQCAICQVLLNKNLQRGCHIDHNHITGRVRGLLCSNCNYMLGNAKDNTNILASAIEYLEKDSNETL